LTQLLHDTDCFTGLVAEGRRRSSSNSLTQTPCVQNRGMDIATGNRVAYPKEQESIRMLTGLCRTAKQRIVVGHAIVS